MHCPHCQAPNADDARFCGACGKPTAGVETVGTGAGAAAAPDAAFTTAPLIGRVIAGRYRISTKLGEGGMGAVFAAEQLSLKRTIAIKLLKPEVAASPLLLRRFNAEAEAVAKLRHPNTINIYDFGQDTDGVLFIAMELIEGRSLRAALRTDAPLPIRRALAIAAQVAASITDAHARTIVHRDLKPDNVMLTDRGRSKDNVTVLDFGIAKLRDDSRATQQAMTQAGDMLGTPQYMAPEQIRGQAIDGRTDIYALGCMLYEMLTGRLPYEAPTVMALLSKHLLEHAPPPSQCRPDLEIPPPIDELVMRAMAKDAAQRPATMEDYGEEIAGLLAALPHEPSAVRSAHGPAAAPFAPASGHGSPPPLGAPPPGPTPAPYPTPGHPTPGHLTPAAAYQSAPPPYYPPPGTPPPLAQPARSSSKALIWVLVAIAVVGGGAGIYAATRDSKPASPGSIGDPSPGSGSQVVDAPPPPDAPPRQESDEDDPWARPPTPGAPSTDPVPAPADPSSVFPDVDDATDDPPPHASGRGETVDVAGIKLVAPAGLKVTRQNGSVVIGDIQKFAIFAGPILEKTNDTDALARSYAKTNHLTAGEVRQQVIAGAKRKVYTFTGSVRGEYVVQMAIPLLSARSRVGVIIHMPISTAQDHVAIVADFLAHGIIVPSLRL